MGGLFTLLLFAGFFYVMMRFGCGAHAVHGHGGGGSGHGADHGGHGDAATSRALPSPADADPVCGMTVAQGQGYTVTHAGHAFRLCSRACLDKFEADPGRYAATQGGVS